MYNYTVTTRTCYYSSLTIYVNNVFVVLIISSNITLIGHIIKYFQSLHYELR